MTRLTLLLLINVIASSGVALAEVPNVPSKAPYIVLSKNLDEPNGYGFCIDTLSRGKTDLMQTHSCKPTKKSVASDSQDNDTRFRYDENTMQVASYAFDGFCMQALIAGETTVFALLECSDHPRQKFVFSVNDQSLRLHEDQKRCVSVALKTIPAGPWVKRPLMLQNCDEIDASLREWTVVTE